MYTSRMADFTSRRAFLAATAGAAMASMGRARLARCASPAISSTGLRMRPDLLDKSAPDGLEIIQLTSDPQIPSCHVYMEAQIFTPDSKRFILHRSAHAHGSDRKDPLHQYLLCDIEDGCSLHPLTNEVGGTGPSVSPDGKYLYYFVDETGQGTGPLTLKRVGMDGTDRQTILVIDTFVKGSKFRPSRVYPLSSISSDGKKLAISGNLDVTTDPAECGLLLFDLEKATVEVLLHGTSWLNMHPQFCRSNDPDLKRDILIQDNRGQSRSARGAAQISSDTAGLCIHVIRDDGTHLRDLSWGRDGVEFCEGHQCWRGTSDWAITSVGFKEEARLIESKPVASCDHAGLKSAGGIRNQLSREFPAPRFHHFAVDRAGKWLITDYEKTTDAARLYLARLGKPGEDPLTKFRCLARPRPSGSKQAHMHPFLSPDGRMAFFNSDESGVLQAFMIRGLST